MYQPVKFLSKILTTYFGNARSLFYPKGVSALVIIAVVLVGCSQPGSSQSSGTTREAFALPTKGPTAAPSPVSTRVMPLEVLTPPPTRTITPIPDEALGLVVEVFDGETIAVVLDGDSANRAYQVRYIGIDAPDTATPWGTVAYETNRKLANLKVVRLVKDETDFSDDGYLLRYVYADNQMLNVLLAERGLAEADLEAPNTTFEADIEEAEARARQASLGIWSQTTPTPTIALTTSSEVTREVAGTQSPTNTPTRTVTAGPTVTTTDDIEPTEEPTQTQTPEPTARATPTP